MIKNNIKQTYGENTTCDFKEAVERKQPKSWLKSTDVFTQFGYMEKRGSGLRKIRNETAKLPGFTNEKRPTFRSQYESFFTEILNNNYSYKVQCEVQNGTRDGSINGSINGSVNGSINGSVKTPKLTKRQLDIINVITTATNKLGSVNGSVKNGLTTQEIMSKLKLSERTAYRELAILKQLGLIQRIGSDKTGHWEVTCPSNVPQDGSINGSINDSINDIDVAVNEADVVKEEPQSDSVNGNISGSVNVAQNVADVAQNVAVKSKKQ